MRSRKSVAVFVIIAALLVACISATRVGMRRIDFKEIPCTEETIFYTESDFTDSFDVIQSWEVYETVSGDTSDVYGLIPGTYTTTLYLNPTNGASAVALITIASEIERVALLTLNQHYGLSSAIFDRWEDTEKFYNWSTEEYLKAYPDEREQIDKSHGI